MNSEPKNVSRRCCKIDNVIKEPFFSLTDYKNNLFISNKLDDIKKFYNSFQRRDDLIEWMKERPTGPAYLREIEGNTDIIVVIPTADFNGKYSKECRENIFNGLHIIFVESGERPDFYFNGAHNENIGIKRAMEYKPNWIVLSNDDMVKEEDISVLVGQLRKINPKEIGIVFCSPGSNYHSKEEYVSTNRKIRSVVNAFLPLAQREAFKVNRRFGTKFFLTGNSTVHSFLYKKIFKFKDTVAFGIYSSEMIEDFISTFGYFFDETYINCSEESDLAIRVQKSRWKIGEVKFRIKPLIGSTLGNSISRYLRDQAGNIYLSTKLEELFALGVQLNDSKFKY